MPRNPGNFRRSVRRSIAFRVGMTAILLGAVFAGITAVTERQRMEEGVVALARATAAHWNVTVRDQLDQFGLLKPGALQDSLKAFMAGNGEQVLEQGRFVYARVHDADGLELAQLEDTSFISLEVIRQAVDAAGFRLPESDDHFVVRTGLDGRPYVALQIALTNKQGKIRAWLDGIFALSATEQARLQANIWRTVLHVLTGILITSLILYPVVSQLLGRLSGLTDRLLDANLETIQVLGGAIAKRDGNTDTHNYRVTVYSIRLAEVVGLDDAQIRALIKGALLHDVGKLGIPDKVLLKPERLDEVEFEIMKAHVQHGLDITGRAAWLAEAQDVVGAHHEKYNGSGYPGGLARDAIPLNARIFAIADVFDALTSWRPYKEPISSDDAMEILEKGRGEHFDPRLLDLFTGIAREVYDQFGGLKGDDARGELGRIMQRYFRRDTAALMP
ncbi:MAG TPA: HD-GYP domain-containing protein [Nitrospirales bacterium]|nr:HD-GYP domain-containing protein [Nitrospirales bacterium]